MQEERSCEDKSLCEEEDPIAKNSASGLMKRASGKFSAITGLEFSISEEEMDLKNRLCLGRGIGAGTNFKRVSSSLPAAQGT